jgi:23S rRNA pseudouridine1911/1915/1917 synthase
MAVVPKGREAITRYQVVEAFSAHSLLDVQPLTGRTHQIRVHLAWLGHPVAGDQVYGLRRPSVLLPDRIFLHAAELQVDSPSTGERLAFLAPLPADLSAVLDDLRRAHASAW